MRMTESSAETAAEELSRQTEALDTEIKAFLDDIRAA